MGHGERVLDWNRSIRVHTDLYRASSCKCWKNTLQGYIVVVVFNHEQAIIDSLKHCTLTVTTDGSEDLLIVIALSPTNLVQHT